MITLKDALLELSKEMGLNLENVETVEETEQEAKDDN